MRTARPITYTVDGRGCHVLTSHRHRLSRKVYEAAHGALAPDLVVRHACDNPLCVNLEHLIPGTRCDDMQDRFERHPRHAEGRAARVNWREWSVIGKAIQRRREDLKVVRWVLAQHLGIRPTLIEAIEHGRACPDGWAERFETALAQITRERHELLAALAGSAR